MVRGRSQATGPSAGPRHPGPLPHCRRNISSSSTTCGRWPPGPWSGITFSARGRPSTGFELGAVHAVRSFVTVPLGIIQDFGWLAVATFFLISGFVITHVACRERFGEFVIKRVFRIYPLLILAVVLSLSLNPELRSRAGLADVLRNMTLANYWVQPQVITVGVAWTLAIEVSYYALTAATMSLCRPRLIVSLHLAVTAAVIVVARQFGPDFFLFAATVAYIPYLTTGQIFYFWVERRALRGWEATVALVSCYAVILFGLTSIHTDFLPATNSYLISFVYACMMFWLLRKHSGRLPQLRLVSFLSATSFSVYIAHSILGPPAMEAGVARWGIYAGTAAAVTATLLGAILLHFVVERPFLVLGRRLATRVGVDRQLKWSALRKNGFQRRHT